MHPFLAAQFDLMRRCVDAGCDGALAAASGMVAMQQMAERSMQVARGASAPSPEASAVPSPLVPMPLWWLPATTPVASPTGLAPFNPLLAWQQAVSTAFGALVSPSGPTSSIGSVEVKVAVRSASGHAMALGIEIPAAPFPGR